jgi:TatD DNase family protein
MIDAHAHLSDVRLVSILDELVARLMRKGVRHVVLGGVDPQDWRRQRELCDRFPNFLTAAFGIHPWTVRDCSDDVLEQMMATLERDLSDVKIMGEIGLDFFGLKDETSRLKQETWCHRQLDLARRNSKPVVIHVVRGHDRMLGMLRRHHGVKGLIHGFRGPADIGLQYIELGMTLSLSLRSFRNDRPELWQWLKGVPVVVESDEPLHADIPADVDAIADRWIHSLRASTDFLNKVGAFILDPFSEKLGLFNS